jgi:protein Tex
MNNEFLTNIVNKVNLDPRKTNQVLKLLAEGCTIPFIARYRKDITGGMDELDIQKISDENKFFTELSTRKNTILKTLKELDVLDNKLQEKIENCWDKSKLEDIYLPYRPKRKTKASTAKEMGLEPLAKKILFQHTGKTLKEFVSPFIDQSKGLNSIEDCLNWVEFIVAEVISENEITRNKIRTLYFRNAVITSKKNKPVDEDEKIFKDYFDYSEQISRIQAHRYLAIKRGENKKALKVKLEIDNDYAIIQIQSYYKLNHQSPFKDALLKSMHYCLKKQLGPSIEKEIFLSVKEKSDLASVEIFSKNLKNILLGAPLGNKAVLGIDPGFRTGCKCAVVNSNGVFVEYQTIYPFENKSLEATEIILNLISKFKPDAIAIGNKTAGKETLKFIKDVLHKNKINIPAISISEDGVSIYSASENARKEFPKLDLTIRGAISIARRLQDPLAELVKLNPKNLGIGQYQHDVDQKLLNEKLTRQIESAVNMVGVDLNTASMDLLSYVSGIGPSMAKKIIDFKEKQGSFESRKNLLNVPSLGKKAYEQCAGFLRIRDAKNPLDNSAVHPESYKLVEQISKDHNLKVKDLLGNDNIIKTINTKKYISDSIGQYSLNDIFEELKKPGRDPRKNFETIEFSKDISDITDLKKGMTLNAVVSNITAFGVFVDIGLKENGLIHISQLCNRFLKDPSEVVQNGMQLKVDVIEIDLNRKRIALSSKNYLK